MKLRLGESLMLEVTPEILSKIKTIVAMLTKVRKAEIDVDRYTIKAWTVDPGNGKKAVCIQIEEG